MYRISSRVILLKPSVKPIALREFIDKIFQNASVLSGRDVTVEKDRVCFLGTTYGCPHACLLQV